MFFVFCFFEEPVITVPLALFAANIENGQRRTGAIENPETAETNCALATTTTKTPKNASTSTAGGEKNATENQNPAGFTRGAQDYTDTTRGPARRPGVVHRLGPRRGGRPPEAGSRRPRRPRRRSRASGGPMCQTGAGACGPSPPGWRTTGCPTTAETRRPPRFAA